LFNTEDKLTFQDIAEVTKIEIEELKKTLKSLSMGTTKILGREGKTRDINDNEVFTFRNDFTSKGRRIKINTISTAETPQETEKIQQNVFKDRVYQVDAAIVRIMKTRKNLSHQSLITELFQQLRFPVKAPDLKKRIDSLLEREFIERDSDDPNSYHYLA